MTFLFCSVAYDDVIFKSTANYTCERGHELSNLSILTCGVNYNWGPGSQPSCRKVVCPSPAKINNGYYLVTNQKSDDNLNQSDKTTTFMYEDIITYKCDSGYKLTLHNQTVKSYSISCLANRSWEQLSSSCEPVSCGKPPQRRHGNVLNQFANKTFVFPEAVTYACNKGYESSNSSTNETLFCSESG